MSRRAATILIAVSALSLVVFVLLWLGREEAPPEPQPTVAGTVPPEDAEPVEVRLYFPGDGGRLYVESRSLQLGGDLKARLATLTTEVLKGPSTPGLLAPLPAGTRLGGVDLVADGVAYVDLRSDVELPPAGSRREMLMIWSLVDSLIMNESEVERVGLLWNGSQRSTFAGHIDLTHPLPADLGLVAPAR